MLPHEGVTMKIIPYKPMCIESQFMSACFKLMNCVSRKHAQGKDIKP